MALNADPEDRGRVSGRPAAPSVHTRLFFNPLTRLRIAGLRLLSGFLRVAAPPSSRDFPAGRWCARV